MKKKDHFIFGIHPVEEALRSGTGIEKIFIQRELQRSQTIEIITKARGQNIPVQRVPPAKLKRLTPKNHQGVVAITSVIEYQDIGQLVPILYEKGQVPLVCVLDGITDVRNFGAIARSAECAGVHALLVPARRTAMLTADAIKTSAGALYHIPVCRTQNPEEAVQFLRSSGLKVVAATGKADNLYYSVDFTIPVALVMGAEDTGVSPEIEALSETRVKIPMQGAIGSLNVSSAASVLLFEILRQRQV